MYFYACSIFERSLMKFHGRNLTKIFTISIKKLIDVYTHHGD